MKNFSTFVVFNSLKVTTTPLTTLSQTFTRLPLLMDGDSVNICCCAMFTQVPLLVLCARNLTNPSLGGTKLAEPASMVIKELAGEFALVDSGFIAALRSCLKFGIFTPILSENALRSRLLIWHKGSSASATRVVKSGCFSLIDRQNEVGVHRIRFIKTDKSAFDAVAFFDSSAGDWISFNA